MNLRRTSAPGFTLFELLIVCSIIPLTTLALYSLMAALGDARVRTWAKANAVEESARAIGIWRKDISLARTVEVGADGRTITISRPGAAGDPLTLVYERNEGGELVRSGDTRLGKPETLVRGVSEIEFESVGRGFGVRWTVEFDDAVRRWHWPSAAFATPLGVALGAGEKTP